MTIQHIKQFLEKNGAPLAWLRVQLRLLPHFNKRGFFLHSMNEKEELDDELIELIDQVLEEIYHLKLA
ncbi:hypothetical protein BKI52_05345 [marine bacterium AO1-C]|nr:hypothetical protein BKI52_05345 [marine bacterium AO1-C]